VEIVLASEERETLERWARRPKTSQRLGLRSRIVPGAAAGEENKSIAARLGCKRGDGGQVAQPVRDAPPRRARRRAAAGAASGNVIAQMTPRHRSEEFRRFLNLIDEEVPQGLDVHVVLGNVSTHKTPTIQRRLLRHPRFSFHFTPTYSSWTNLVERWFSELTTKRLRRGADTSVKDLTDSIQQWTDNWNRAPEPFTWHKSADDIFKTMASYLQRIPQTGH